MDNDGFNVVLKITYCILKVLVAAKSIFADLFFNTNSTGNNDSKEEIHSLQG